MNSLSVRFRAFNAFSLFFVLISLLAWPATAASPDPGPNLGTNLTWLRPNTS